MRDMLQDFLEGKIEESELDSIRAECLINFSSQFPELCEQKLKVNRGGEVIEVLEPSLEKMPFAEHVKLYRKMKLNFSGRKLK